jgi:hypothetical protein
MGLSTANGPFGRGTLVRQVPEAAEKRGDVGILWPSNRYAQGVCLPTLVGTEAS